MCKECISFTNIFRLWWFIDNHNRNIYKNNKRKKMHKDERKWKGPVKRPGHPPLAYFSCLESGMFHSIITNIPNIAQSTSLGSDPMKNALSPVIKNNIKTQAPDVIYLIKNIQCIPLPNIFNMKKNKQRQVPVHQNYKKTNWW